MIAVDTNLLVAAHRRELPRQSDALKRLKTLAEGTEAWGIPVMCIAEFLRVVTHAGIWKQASTIAEALTALSSNLDTPMCSLLVPGAGFRTRFEDALREGQATGNLVFDAQIVAVCREAGVKTIITMDRDFKRFSSPKVELI